MTDKYNDLRAIIHARFGKKKATLPFIIGFTIIYFGGFGLLWYETSWKVALAVFLIAYGVMLQGHFSFVERDS